MTTAKAAIAPDWLRGAERDRRTRFLQVVQPALIGLIDGTISTLAPIFAAAFVGGTRAALLVGLAAALGAAISMGMSEALSDDGDDLGPWRVRRPGAGHGRRHLRRRRVPRPAVPDPDLVAALAVAGGLVAAELWRSPSCAPATCTCRSPGPSTQVARRAAPWWRWWGSPSDMCDLPLPKVLARG